MCLGQRQAQAIGVLPNKNEYKNRPVTVTGTQTGVDDPKDTAKATETLKIKRQKEEGTYVDPNAASLTTAAKLTRSGGMGAVARNQRSARLRSGVSRGPKAATKAQKAAAARKASRSKR